jgi:hypothetical protein
MVEPSLIIAGASLILSVTAICRRGRTGAPGPAGKDGVSASAIPGPAPAIPAVNDAAHIECVSCHKVVARYNSAGRCANCAPTSN